MDVKLIAMRGKLAFSLSKVLQKSSRQGNRGFWVAFFKEKLNFLCVLDFDVLRFGFDTQICAVLFAFSFRK
jgi:hypothetical protein